MSDNPTNPTLKQRKKRIKAADIADGIKKTRGNVSACATALGVDRSHLHERIKRDARLRKLLNAQRQIRIDYAVSALDTAIANGEPWAVSLTLRTLGRKRGYGERFEHTGKNGEPLSMGSVTIFNLPNNGRQHEQAGNDDHQPASGETNTIPVNAS